MDECEREEHRHDEVSGPVGIESQSESHGCPPEQARARGRAHEQNRRHQKDERKKIRVESPARNHYVPRTHCQQHHPDARRAAIGGLAQKPKKKWERRKTRQQERKAGAPNAKAEKPDEGCLHVRRERVHARAPRNQHHRKMEAVSIDAVVGKGEGIVSRRGLVLIQTRRNRPKVPGAQPESHDHRRKQNRIYPAQEPAKLKLSLLRKHVQHDRPDDVPLSSRQQAIRVTVYGWLFKGGAGGRSGGAGGAPGTHSDPDARAANDWGCSSVIGSPRIHRREGG